MLQCVWRGLRFEVRFRRKRHITAAVDDGVTAGNLAAVVPARILRLEEERQAGSRI